MTKVDNPATEREVRAGLSILSFESAVLLENGMVLQPASSNAKRQAGIGRQ